MRRCWILWRIRAAGVVVEAVVEGVRDYCEDEEEEEGVEEGEVEEGGGEAERWRIESLCERDAPSTFYGCSFYCRHTRKKTEPAPFAHA